MSLVKPRSLFNTQITDSYPVQRLTFDSDEEDKCPVSPTLSQLGLDSSSSSAEHCLSMSDGDFDHLDSSTDSAVDDMTSVKRSSTERCVNFDDKLRLKNNSVSVRRNKCDETKGDTPPYRRVRALRLFGSPQTPKTLLKQSELTTTEVKNRNRTRLFNSKPVDTNDNHDTSFTKPRRIRPPTSPLLQANINPFTTTGMLLNSRQKRRRTPNSYSMNGCTLNSSLEELMEDVEEQEVEDIQPPKRIHLRDTNISRYATEFLEVCQIGSGEFGSVYKCINRLDGCVYALKKSRKPLKGTSDERTALNEVYAHAVLGRHPHVVRYFSAWAEDDHMLIQNEYCNGGSLADAIEENQRSGATFIEAELKKILLHVAKGLKYIHSQHLAHMDIKPGNIFITRNPKPVPISRVTDSSDDGFEDDEATVDDLTYKIGDLGHVTSIANPQVEEGDCRYLPLEILHDDYCHLTKADIFALGLTIFETGGGGPLPRNESEWHAIREGNLPFLTHYSKDLNSLLKQMIHPDQEIRPSAAALAQHKTIVPYANKTKAQLNKELNAEKFKNELLSRQLQQAAKCLKGLPLKSSSSESRLNRIIGRKINRSSSVTNF